MAEAVQIIIEAEDKATPTTKKVVDGVEQIAKAVNGLKFDEGTQRWRNALGHFASDAEMAAAGVEVIPRATKSAVSVAGDAFQGLGGIVQQAMGGAVNAAKAGAGALTGAFRGLGSAIHEIMVGALRRIGEMITETLANGARAVAGFLKESIQSAGDFEQTLNVLAATSGATKQELAAVSQRAKDLGADLTLPATSAGEAAEVMLELSKAGMSVQESMDAAKGSLQLAAAAQTDGATAAGIMSGALNSFELEATDAVRIADLLAGAANASSASMTDLGQGVNQAGFIFHAAEVPIDDLVTSLAALTNVGLTGTDAGTALKNAMMRLMNPTKEAAQIMDDLGISAYDAMGNMRSWPDILENIRQSTAGMTKEQRDAALGTIFLSDGMKGLLPLLNMTDEEYKQLRTDVSQAGAASEVANAQMKGWNGAIAGISSQLETFGLVIGQKILPTITPFAFRISELIGQFTTLTEKFITMLPTIASAESPFRTLLTALVILNPSLIGVTGLLFRMVDVIMPIIEGFNGASSGAYGIANALSTVLSPLGATSSSVVIATEALLQIWNAAQQVAGILSGQFSGGVGGAQSAVAGLVNFVLGSVLPALAVAATWFATNLPTAIQAAQSAFTGLGSFISAIMPTILGIISSTLTLIVGFWTDHGAQVMQIVNATFTVIGGIIQVALGVIQGLMAIWVATTTGDWTTGFQTLAASNTTIWQGISSFFTGILEIIAAGFGTSLTEIVDVWKGNLEKLPGVATSVMTAALDTFKAALSAAPAIGKAVVDGIVNGIKSGIGSIIAAARSVAKAALDAAMGALRAHSPSLESAEKVGLPFSQGVAVGITQGVGDAVAAAQSLVQQAVGGAQNALAPIGATAGDIAVKASSSMVGAGQSLLGRAISSGVASRTTTNAPSFSIGNLVVNAAPGQSERKIADSVIDRLDQRTGGRR